jgi:TonB family protein
MHSGDLLSVLRIGSERNIMRILCSVRHSAFLTVLAFASLVPALTWGQSVQDQLNSAYKGKVLLLRNFYSDSDLEYDQDGAPIGITTVGPWTLADMEITSVAVTARGIEITGNRVGTWFRNGKPDLARIGKLKIHVTRSVSDGDTEKVLRTVLGNIFVEPGEEFGRSAPEYWRFYFGGTDFKSRSAAWRDALREGNPKAAANDALPRPVFTAPVPVSHPDPTYTKAARAHRVEGLSRLGITVDPTGATSNIAILDPLGMGLDDQAVLAVKRWKFRPATKDGHPIQVQVNVDITFKCYSSTCP